MLRKMKQQIERLKLNKYSESALSNKTLNVGLTDVSAIKAQCRLTAEAVDAAGTCVNHVLGI